MAGKLTAKVVEQFSGDPSGKRREVPDGLIAGLYLVVQTTGAKSQELGGPLPTQQQAA